jgi:signal transduction histidine kinase
MYGVKDFASIAAWAGDKPVAFISVDHNITHRPITDEQLEALRLFAGYAGLAIENTRLNEKIQEELSLQIRAKEREEHRREILEKVVILGQHVTEVSDIRTTLMRIWHGVHDDLGFDRLGIYMYNPEHNSMDGTFGTNIDGEMIDEWHTSVSMKEENPESKSFLRVIEKPNTIYITHTYTNDYNTPEEGHIMSGVKDFAAIAAWAGDKPVAVLCVDHVISGRPITEEQLEALRLFAGYAGLAIENARLNSALEGELSQRKNFIVELEAKNAELERFTYTVSHDLKSPLVTIKGFLGYLEKDAQAGNYEKLKQDKLRIESAVEKMQNLLKDLLELSRIGRLMNSPVEIPFNEIIKDTLEIVHGQIEAGKVLVEVKSSDIIIKCDRIRLTEVMQNLIDNAIKFMGTQSAPRIEIGNFLDKNENVFYVKDNGIGIAPEFYGKIFGLFDKLTNDSDGTGIGLALVKRIIEVHGGRIWVESQIGQGTTFYFTLAKSD